MKGTAFNMVIESINTFIVTGSLKDEPTLRTRPDGSMVCTCSLRLEEASPSGSVFRTFVTIEARGKVAEAVRVCRAGDVVLVQGKLFWRKVSIPEGGQDVSSLALLVQRCSVLIPNTQEVSYD